MVRGQRELEESRGDARRRRRRNRLDRKRKEDHHHLPVAPDPRAVHASTVSPRRREQAPGEAHDRRPLPDERVPSRGVRLGLEDVHGANGTQRENRPRRARKLSRLPSAAEPMHGAPQAVQPPGAELSDRERRRVALRPGPRPRGREAVGVGPRAREASRERPPRAVVQHDDETAGPPRGLPQVARVHADLRGLGVVPHRRHDAAGRARGCDHAVQRARLEKVSVPSLHSRRRDARGTSRRRTESPPRSSRPE